MHGINKKEKATYGGLLRFFIPLAIMPMMISMTHTIINASLARLPLPEMSIAIFTVVKSITNIANAPTIMSRQLIVSLIDSKKNYRYVRKFVWIMAFVLFGIILLFGLTSLGNFLLEDLIGIKDPKAVELAKSALVITSFLPIVVLFRNVYQGMATALKRTNIVIPGVLLRLILITTFLWWVVRTEVLTGVMAGSIAWIVGIAIEGLFIFGFILYFYKSPVQAAGEMPDHDQGDLNFLKVFKFFSPLALMILLTKVLQPIIQSGIARGQSPTKSLAAYGVAWTLVFLFSGSLRMLNQLSMVYTEKVNDANWYKVKRFSIMVGVVISIVMIISALTPIGYFLLHRVIAVSDVVTKLAQQTMLAFSIYPIIRAFRESYWGVLMKQRTTKVIARAKTANLIIVSLVIFIALGLFSLSTSIPAAVVGAIAFTLGELLETIVIWRSTIKEEKCILAETKELNVM